MRSRLPALKGILTAAAFGAIGLAVLPGTAAAIPSCAAPTVDVVEENRLAWHLQMARRDPPPPFRPAAALERLPRLVAAGRVHSRWMARTGLFEHPTSGLAWADGRPAAQNLAFAPNSESAIAGLLASDEHKANMLPRRWRFFGIGAFRCDGMVLYTINVLD